MKKFTSSLLLALAVATPMAIPAVQAKPAATQKIAQEKPKAEQATPKKEETMKKKKESAAEKEEYGKPAEGTMKKKDSTKSTTPAEPTKK